MGWSLWHFLHKRVDDHCNQRWTKSGIRTFYGIPNTDYIKLQKARISPPATLSALFRPCWHLVMSAFRSIPDISALFLNILVCQLAIVRFCLIHDEDHCLWSDISRYVRTEIKLWSDNQNSARQTYHLLHFWKKIPGMKEDYSIDKVVLKEWFTKARNLAESASRLFLLFYL